MHDKDIEIKEINQNYDILLEIITAIRNGHELTMPEYEEMSLKYSVPVSDILEISESHRSKYIDLWGINKAKFPPVPEKCPYIRVGVDYFKVIEKTDRWGIERMQLKPWRKDEIKQDHGAEYLKAIPKYDDFTLKPDNINYKRLHKGSFNRYCEFRHKPAIGEWTWTQVILKHIFGEQYDLGLRYFQILYLFPERMLPILSLVSKLRQTAKTTTVNWLSAIFGGNLVIIGSQDISSSFNSYATANIIVIEETLIDKAASIEKIKALGTAKNFLLNEKFMQPVSIPFFGKIIITSNNENRFAKIDNEEIRFWVRKLGKPTIQNHNIEEDLIKEIPAFLYHLTTLPSPDFSKDRTGFTPEELYTSELAALKKESKSSLYHDLTEMFTEFFNNQSTGEECYCTVSDIKNKWFAYNNQVDHRYIKHVITNEFNLQLEPLQRYAPFADVVTRKVGTPYIFTKDLFIEITNIQDNEAGKLPF